MDLVKFAKYNDGYRYIFVVIDVFSKYLWLRKLKDKKGESVANAFETIFKEGRKPYKIRTDKGQAFRARAVQSVFTEAGIKHFYAQYEVKASVAEQVIKTIKNKNLDILHSSSLLDILTNSRVLLKDTIIRFIALLIWNQQK